jgi:hypothetical protein
VSATQAVKRSQFVPGNQPGTVAVKVGADTVLSIQPDGSIQTRPVNKIGPWESGSDQQGKWVVSDGAYPTGSYALLIVE